MENLNTETCANCKFFLGRGSRPNEIGECRRYPPVFLYSLGRDDDGDYELHGDESSPTVIGKSWCGEFTCK